LTYSPSPSDHPGDDLSRPLDQETGPGSVEDWGWDDILQDFDDIQADLHYRQAQDTLRALLSRFDLTPRETIGLEQEIQSLERMLSKLDQQVVQIAVFGMVGRGKSSLLNALLGQSLFTTGPTHGVTKTVQSTRWSIHQEVLDNNGKSITRLFLKGRGDSYVELVDTPGIDEVDGEAREMLAKHLARQADLILFVIAGDMTRVEYDALSELRLASKPILLVFNKIDQYPTADRLAIYETIRDQRVRELLSPDEIVMAAASPLIPTAVRSVSGKLEVNLSPGLPQVEDLKLKILQILHQEGKSLVALNTMLYADEVNEQLVARKLEIRDRAADDIIWQSVITKGIAIALNPVMVVDLVAGVIVDVAMIVALSKLYGIPMTQHGAVKLLQTIAFSSGSISAAELVTTLGLSSLKTVLGLSTVATGGLAIAPYIPVALTQAGVAGVSSYAIGQVTKSYLGNGASWGTEGTKAVVTRILDSLNETSILNRVKDELKAKLQLMDETNR